MAARKPVACVKRGRQGIEIWLVYEQIKCSAWDWNPEPTDCVSSAVTTHSSLFWETTAFSGLFLEKWYRNPDHLIMENPLGMRGCPRGCSLRNPVFSPPSKANNIQLDMEIRKKRITFNTHNITRLFSNGFTILNTYSITVFCGNLCGIWSMPGHFTTTFLPKGEHRHFAGHSVISQDTARHRTKMIGLRGTCIVIDKLYEK